jgi:REP element-mobilizing transposase RayT
VRPAAPPPEITPAPGTGRRSYPRRRSSSRLGGFDYTGGHRYHVVVITHNRTRVFDDPDWASRGVELLLTTARMTGFDIDAYCVMPDHIHFLAAGHAQEQSDLQTLAHRFKQKLGFEFRQASGRVLWQRSYYEHVLRPEEPLLPYVAYILGNPVRAGLVETVDQWPHSGPPEVLARSRDADRSEGLSLQLKASVAGIEREMSSLEHGELAGAKASSLHPDGDALHQYDQPTTPSKQVTRHD